jgi:hypothetical protein
VWCSSSGDQVTNPFFVDARRPTRRNDRIHAELDQQVPELKGIKQIGVEDDRR